MRQLKLFAWAVLIAGPALAGAFAGTGGVAAPMDDAVDRISEKSAPTAETGLTEVTLSADELVDRLGSGSFRERNLASRELARRGLAAKAALLRGLDADDAEIRWRCQKVLVRVMDLDYRARLAAFMRDTEGKADHGLAGWERFRQIAGDGKGARELFVEMQEAEAGLLETSLAGPDQTSQALEQRCRQMQQTARGQRLPRRQRTVSLGSVAAMFFLASDREVAVSDQVVHWLHSLSHQQALQTAIRGGPKVEPLRKLLGAWVSRATGAFTTYPSLILALNHDLREGLEPAIALLRQGGVQPQIVQYALLVVGRFGNKEHVAVLEPFLDDAAVCVTFERNNQQFRTEVRDVALAALLHLSGQDLPEYGFDRLEKNPKMLFNPASLGFADDAQRAKALEKWKAWRQDN